MKKMATVVKKNSILILILLLFLFSRLFRISQIPASLYWDEASIGYNAYSVLHTGRDEWGEVLPLHFRAFGEFKLPVYVYCVMFFEIIFGLSPLAVRIPAVIFGLMCVLGVYFLVETLVKNKTISLTSSFLFSITPWFFIFSRTGYEATAGLAFFIWAVYFWLQSKKHTWGILLSVILFVLSAYSYNAFRILTLLVLGPLMLYRGYAVFRKENRQKVLSFLISGMILFLSVIPAYKLYSHDAGLGRLYTVGTTKNFISNYLKNYSIDFLFVSGDTNPRSQVPGSPQLYFADALFVLLGLIFVYRKKNPSYLMFPAALILSPVTAAITKENPHALRSILAAPVLSVLSAIGIYYFVDFFKTGKRIVFGSIIILYLLFFEGYFYKFGTQYNTLSSNEWQLPYKEIIQKNSAKFVSFEKVVLSDKYAQPYIFVLFYEKINPKEFLSSKVLNDVSDWGFSTVSSFGKFEFVKNCSVDPDENTLLLCP